MDFTLVQTDEPLGAWGAVLYQEQHPNNLNYFRSQVNSFSNTLTDIGKSFIHESKNIYDKLNSSEAIAAAKAAIRGAAGVFNKFIRPLVSFEECRAAPVIMQRWVMANPEVRNLYHKQQCAGYTDTYVDVEPNLVGREHYDYRRVMTGVVEDTNEGSFATHYVDELHEGDNELTHEEKFGVIDTWNLMNMFIQASKGDPTDPYGGNL